MRSRELARLDHASRQIDAAIAAEAEKSVETGAAFADNLSKAVDEAASSYLVNGLAQALIMGFSGSAEPPNGALVATFVARWLTADEPSRTRLGWPQNALEQHTEVTLVAAVVRALLEIENAPDYRFLEEEAIQYVAKLKLYAKARTVRAAPGARDER